VRPIATELCQLALLAAEPALLRRLRPRIRHDVAPTVALGVALTATALPALSGTIELMPAVWLAQSLCLIVALLGGRARRGLVSGPALVDDLDGDLRRVRLILVDGTRLELAVRPRLARRLCFGEPIIADVAAGRLVGARPIKSSISVLRRPPARLPSARVLVR
jgi:hypothetical protein